MTTVELAAGTVRSIRRSLKLSQARFAQEFGFTPATVRNWEQGRNQPDKSARILLAVIKTHPDIVRGAAKLRRGKQGKRSWAMKKQMFEELLSSVRESGAILRGEKEPSRRYTIRRSGLRVIRERTTLSQSEFAHQSRR